jgi:hypothetical protein
MLRRLRRAAKFTLRLHNRAAKSMLRHLLRRAVSIAVATVTVMAMARVMVMTMAVMAVAMPLAMAAFMTVMAVSTMALVSLRRGRDVRRDL